MAQQPYRATRQEQHVRDDKQRRREHKELAHTWRRLTPAEIAAQYPPERVAALFAEAKQTSAAALVLIQYPSFAAYTEKGHHDE